MLKSSAPDSMSRQVRPCGMWLSLNGQPLRRTSSSAAFLSMPISVRLS